jgi:hypothetical protein
MFWSGCGKAAQGEGRREHVLAETRIRVLRIKRVDQQSILWSHRAARLMGIKRRWGGHLGGNPALPDGAKEGLVGCNHGRTLYYKVLHVNQDRAQAMASRNKKFGDDRAYRAQRPGRGGSVAPRVQISTRLVDLHCLQR